jgi:hypothetical protein
MATKLIAFRISGDILEKAIALYGEDQLVEYTRKLLTDSILGQLPDQPIPDPGDSKIGLLEKAIAALNEGVSAISTKLNELELNQINLANNQLKPLPRLEDMNTEKPKSNIIILKELVGAPIKDSPARVKAKFKKLTGIDADSLGENSYPDLMLKYLQDNYNISDVVNNEISPNT